MDRLLMDLGIPPSALGFEYIKAAVGMVQKIPRKDIKIMAMYHDIASSFNTTCSRVERAIRYAIALSIKSDHGEMKSLIGISPYKNRVSNQEFIYALAYAIREGE